MRYHLTPARKVIIPKSAAAKSLQLCLTLCNPMDSSPPGSPVPGILQARTLEWVAISFSNACKWKVKVKSLSRVWLFVTPWTAAYQAPPSMGFSRQEYWSGLPLPSPIPKSTNNKWWRVWRKGNTLALLVGMRIDIATIENIMEVPWKTKNRVSIWSSNPTPGTYPEKTMIPKYTCTQSSLQHYLH